MCVCARACVRARVPAGVLMKRCMGRDARHPPPRPFYHLLTSFQHSNSLHATYPPQLVAELDKLTNWYVLCARAYRQLPDEVARRRAANARMHAIAEEARARLRREYLSEWQLRETFAANLGLYLPVSLCPALGEAPPNFEVVPEAWSSALPDLGGGGGSSSGGGGDRESTTRTPAPAADPAGQTPEIRVKVGDRSVRPLD